MNVTRKSFYILTIVFFLIVLSCGKGSPPAEAGGRAAVGGTAPDFVLKNIDGTDVRLSDLRGKVVLLNFWATWCPPCRSEMPSIESLNRKMKGYDFIVLAVSIDGIETSRLRNFVVGNGYTFSVLHDPEQTVADTYLVMGIPTTYIVDKNGTIVDKSVGAESWDSSERIRQLMSLVR